MRDAATTARSGQDCRRPAGSRHFLRLRCIALSKTKSYRSRGCSHIAFPEPPVFACPQKLSGQISHQVFKILLIAGRMSNMSVKQSPFRELIFALRSEEDAGGLCYRIH